MARKYDVVVEAVRYQPDGQIRYLRVYERRGPTFTDRVLLDRQQVLNRMKAGKVFVIGERIPRLASTFEITLPLRLAAKDGNDVITTRDGEPEHDDLQGTPVF